MGLHMWSDYGSVVRLGVGSTQVATVLTCMPETTDHPDVG